MLSIVIVNYFSERVLNECLYSLSEVDTPIDVIVVDNGSDAPMRRDLEQRHSRARWISAGGNVGFGRACNAGARAASGRHLLFLNPDSTVEAGMAWRLVERLERADGAGLILGCRILNTDGSRQLSCRRFPTWKAAVANRYSVLTRLWPGNPWSREYLKSDSAPEAEGAVDWVSGAAMAMRRETFEWLGGFSDEYFMYMEDVDLCKRGKALGIETRYYPAATVRHAIGGSSRRAPARALGYRHRSIWTYYRKHLRVWAADPLVAGFLLARWGVLAALSWARGMSNETGTGDRPGGLSY